MRFFLAALFTLVASTAFAEPLVKANNLVYQGAFRVPIGDFGDGGFGGFSYGGGAVAYNPAGSGSLFMLGHVQKQKVAEISIPTPVVPISATNLTGLPYATVLQNFADPTEGNRALTGSGGSNASDGNSTNIGGLLVYGEKLIGTSFPFYSTLAQLSHFTSNLTLATAGDFSGMYAVGSPPSTPTASYVSGWMGNVPPAYQTSLGGTALTGNGNLSIISRTSHGPAAFAFDPSRLGIDTPVVATPLLYYPTGHELAADTSTGPLFNTTTKMAGVAMVNGSRSVLFFGYHGIGPWVYGNHSADPIFADTCSPPDVCTTGPKGWPICSDPSNCITGRKGIPYDPLVSGSGSDGAYYDPTGMGAKGPHAYPYINQVWAYDSDELAAVKAGTKQPWEVLPYATWELPFAVAPTDLFGGAATYDAATGRLFIVQPQGDSGNQYNKMPLIHVFQTDMNASVAASYAIKPRVMLLKGNVTLKNNGGDDLVVSAASRTTIQTVAFTTPIDPAGSYNVTISAQPSGQTCTVANGVGTVDANNDISNIVVTCTGAGSSAPAPTTTPSKAPGRYLTTQQLSLTASAGVAKYCFGAGCTPTATYSAPLRVPPVNTAGGPQWALRVQSVDGTNVEPVQELVFLKQRRR